MSAKKISVALGLGAALVWLAWTILLPRKEEWSPTNVKAFQVVYENEAKTFELQWKSRDAASGSIPGKQMSTRITGTLIQEILEHSDGREAVALRWESPIASMGSTGAAVSQHLPLEQSLKKGTTFFRKSDGSLESVAQAKDDIDRSAIGILAEIYAMTQRNRQESKQEWSVTEQDLFGKYAVSYNYDARKHSLRKFNKSYTPELNAVKVALQDPLFSQDQKAEVTLDLTFEGFDSKSFSFQTAHGSQLTKIRVADQLILESFTRLTINSLAHQAVTTQMDPAQLQATDLVSIENFARNSTNFIEPAVTKDEIHKGLDEFKEHKDVRDETEFVLKLRAYLRQNPDKADAMIQLLDNYSVESAEYLAILRAIVASQVPQAQAELLTFIENKITSGGPHIIVLAHLAEFDRPGLELIDALKKYGESPNEDLRSTSLLALGTAGAQVAKYDAPQAQNVFQDLKSRLESNQDLSEKSTLWGALGNYAGPEVWPLVQAEYPRSSVELRHRIVNALRMVSGEGPQAFLLEKAASGESEAIRMTSVSALTLRSPQEHIVLGLAKSLFNEPSVNVQSVILSYLAQNTVNFPQAGEKIQEFLRKFPNSEASKAFVQQRTKGP